jgi:hypothetical protein
MTYQRAILVPAHGLREAIRAVGYIRETTSANGSLSPSGTPALPSTIEIWLGDFYGEPRELITSHPASDRVEFVFSANESPVVASDRSLVVVIPFDASKSGVPSQRSVLVSTPLWQLGAENFKGRSDPPEHVSCKEDKRIHGARFAL